jgi:hypothetical protein
MENVIKTVNAHINKIIIVLFAAMFVIGICVYDDYGVMWDDDHERGGTLGDLKVVADRLGIVNDFTKSAQALGMDGKGGGFYGHTIQMPATLIELLTSDNSSPEKLYWGSRNAYLYRHLSVFIVYFISLIFFYLLCRLMFKSKILAILGALMIYLYPRFFANSFYSIKDIMFSSLLVIALYFCVLFLTRNRKFKYAALSGLFLALATNARFYGLSLFGLVLALMFLEDLISYLDKKNKHKMLGGKMNRPSLTKGKAESASGTACGGKKGMRLVAPYLSLIISFFLCYIILTPSAWSVNLYKLLVGDAVSFISSVSGSGGISVLFNGVDYIKTGDLPRIYCLAWLGISIPITYLVFSILGIIRLAKKSVLAKNFLDGIIEHRILLLMCVELLAPLVMTFVKKGVLYDEWRQIFFIFPYIVLFAVYGIQQVYAFFRNIKIKYAIIVLMSLTLIFQAGWMITNHPYQNVYFNAIGEEYADKFERDYYGLSQYQLLSYLAQKFPDGRNLKVASVYSAPLYTQLVILPGDLKDRFTLFYSDNRTVSDEVEFIISTLRWIPGNEFNLNGFKEFYSIWVDGYKIGTILQRQ